MSKIDNKYGEFVSLAKIIIQGPQETWNIESNIKGDAYWAFTFPQLLHNQSIWYPWHCVTSYLVLLSMMVHKLILVIPKSYDAFVAIVI
jgi:hypothetical protein